MPRHQSRPPTAGRGSNGVRADCASDYRRDRDRSRDRLAGGLAAVREGGPRARSPPARERSHCPPRRRRRGSSTSTSASPLLRRSHERSPVP